MKNNDKSRAVAIGRVGSASGLKGEFRINLYTGDSSNLKEGKHLLFRHVGQSAAAGAGSGSKSSRGAGGASGTAGAGGAAGSAGAGSADAAAGAGSTNGAAGAGSADSAAGEKGSCDAEFSAECRSVRYQKDKPVVSVIGIDDRNAAEAIRGMEVCLEEDELDELPEGEHYVKDLIGCTVRDIASGDDIGVLRDVIQNTAQSVLEVETADGRQVLIPAVDAFMRNIDEEARLIEVELIPGFI